jgi:hypothetical protein
MRLITLKVWEKKGYTINQLHDCVLCHPNMVNTVFESIEDLYTSDIFDNLASKIFFTPMQEGLNNDSKRQILEIQEKFDKNSDFFTIIRGQFIPSFAYTFEGSVKMTKLYDIDQKDETKKN